MSTAPFPAPGSERIRFADEIRVLMTRRRLTQGDLATVLGVGQSEISKRLRGTVPFRFDEIVELARYFDVSIGSLFGEDSTRRPDGPDGGGQAASRGVNKR
ncbi:helix-turn-helix domain-containing protein [Nocardioides kongjuensis]|uniref:Transcriptional regulator with XRE-family HTH domain n=1 Tax=Nocardioides kongjuensis TaxID=349522 RepID=A0A852RSZ5_9ACTN|nr:helix-turn-helix transcriptional regulator [Nocardioides kongjuensis]NYD33879.1 transcriptional regulator with XRE-family HTH domain [Nocardioides kongjuensis]